METNDNTIYFKSDLQTFTLVGFILIFFLFIYFYLTTGQIEILILIFLSILILIYILYDFYNSIDQISYNNECIIVKKKFKIYYLKNISEITIYNVKIPYSIIIKIKLDNGSLIKGFCLNFRVEYEKLIKLLKYQNINYKIEYRIIKI